MNARWQQFLAEETNNLGQLALHSFKDNRGDLFEGANEEKISLALYDSKILRGVLTSQEILQNNLSKPNYASEILSSGAVIGMVSYLNGAYDQDTCFNASEIIRSAVTKAYRGKGYGKLLYLLALSKVYPTPLMADRFSVSADAEKVWKSLDSDSQIQKLPPNEKPFLGQFDDIQKPVTPPDKDDCKVHKPTQKHSSINKAYATAKKRGLVKLLEKRDEQFSAAMKQLSDKDDTVYYSFQRLDWGLITSLLFRDAYAEGGD